MKFTLEINCDNAAFSPESGGDLEMEVAMLLRDAATRIENGEGGTKLQDSNGNTVGQYYFTS